MRHATRLPLVLLLLLAVHALAQAPRSEWTLDPFEPWKPMPYTVSYFNLFPTADGKGIELWFDARAGEHDAVIGLTGPSLDQLPRTPPRFDASIVQGYTRHLPERQTPILSRASALRLRDGSYAVLASVGPQYTGGGTELYPALFHSPDGSPGSWKHLGPPAGEPRDWLDHARRTNARIRCEGAGLVQLADGSLRLYMRGFGVQLAAAHAPRLDQPWSFVRDDTGAIRDLERGLPGGGWVFSHVTPLGDRAFLLTGANAWPPTELWAATSDDGIHFRVLSPGPTPQPLLRPADVAPGATMVKCVRGWWNPDTQTLDVVANPWDDQRQSWRLHMSRARLTPPATGPR